MYIDIFQLPFSLSYIIFKICFPKILFCVWITWLRVLNFWFWLGLHIYFKFILETELSLLLNCHLQKKPSIPNTVSRILKYIPELRKEIEKLIRKRAKFLAATKQSIAASSLVISKSGSNTGAERLIDFKHSPPSATLGSPDHLIVTVNAALESSQMMITIYNCRVGFPFSSLFVLLGKERFDVLNASTFIYQDKVYYNLHLEVGWICLINCHFLSGVNQCISNYRSILVVPDDCRKEWSGYQSSAKEASHTVFW